MRKMLMRSGEAMLRHRYGLTLFTFLVAALIAGLGSVYFMWGFEKAMNSGLRPDRIGWLAALTTPILFLASMELVKQFAPAAEGSGIPQVAFAASRLTPDTQARLAPLTSMRTMTIKVAAVLLAVAGGASTGREGPTVHVAACLFMAVVLLAKRFLPIAFDLRSAVVAGGSAGLAAAFNTPLAGVTFAIEELGSEYFGGIKDFVLVAIIVAALAAKSLTGEYTYFGRLGEPMPLSFTLSAFIGVAGGLLGALFSSGVLRGCAEMRRLSTGRRRTAVVLMALCVLGLSWVAGPEVMGPGNGAARALVQGGSYEWAWAFPGAKLLATLLTYWAGVAGGVFAPSLSIGAALGADIGRWLHKPSAACAMVGMAAFLAGAIQAPITAFVIIFEMTGHHTMLLPIMTGSLFAFMAARVTGAKHLYHHLSLNYGGLLGENEPPRQPKGLEERALDQDGEPR